MSSCHCKHLQVRRVFLSHHFGNCSCMPLETPALGWRGRRGLGGAHGTLHPASQTLSQPHAALRGGRPAAPLITPSPAAPVHVSMPESGQCYLDNSVPARKLSSPQRLSVCCFSFSGPKGLSGIFKKIINTVYAPNGNTCISYQNKVKKKRTQPNPKTYELSSPRFCICHALPSTPPPLPDVKSNPSEALQLEAVPAQPPPPPQSAGRKWNLGLSSVVNRNRRVLRCDLLSCFSCLAFSSPPAS